jgi:hypothetical protein
MDLNKIIAGFGFTAIIVVMPFIAFAADEVTAGVENPVASSVAPVVSVSNPPAPAPNENDTQWAWGEVTNLDSASKTITLKYLDYETDQEKNIAIVVDDKTTFENVKGLDEVKVKDTLSIDYIVGPDGKNIARNIGLESPDSPAAVPAQAAGENKQVDTQAAPQQPTASSEAAVEANTAVANNTTESAIQK